MELSARRAFDSSMSVPLCGVFDYDQFLDHFPVAASTTMAVREGLGFETTIERDCAPLAAPIRQLIESGIAPHCQRDLTRGLATGLIEIAEAANAAIRLDEPAIPVSDSVRAEPARSSGSIRST